MPRTHSSARFADTVVSRAHQQAVSLYRTLFRAGLAQNVASLYAVQCCSYILPLLTVPFLCRTLGVDGWGLVIFGQSFANILVLIAEYGFDLSGTREVSQSRNSKHRLAQIVAGVLGAKFLLASLIWIIAMVAQTSIPVFAHNPKLLWASAALATAQALNMMWFYAGIEQVRTAAMIDISTRAAGAACLLLLIRSPLDAWKVPAIQAAAATLSFAAALGLAYRTVPLRAPSSADTLRALRMGKSMVLFRLAESSYTMAAPFLLGLLSDLRFVGFYGAAEKICRSAFVSILDPINRSLYPRLNHLVTLHPPSAAQLLRRSTFWVGAFALLLGLGAFLLAPVLVRLILGNGFHSSVIVLRILAILPPAIAAKWLIGLQWMVALRLDKPFNAFIVLSTFIHVTVFLLLVPSHAHVGMAIAVAMAEISIPIAIWLFLRRKRLDPWSAQYVIPSTILPRL